VEKESRRFDAARQLFQQGLSIDPRHLHLWQVRVFVCDGVFCVGGWGDVFIRKACVWLVWQGWGQAGLLL
jgi:hypothetical protein